jgi:CheY-like chemotaxis protein
MEKFYTTFDVARICRVSPGSVIRWIKDGKLQASCTAGGHHRVNTQDLIKFLKTLRIPIPPELTEERQALRILVVDDEPGMRQLFRWVVNTHWPEVLVEEAEEGFSAGWKAHGMRPDLVFLDVMIPGMDGFRVCQFIRNFPELKDTHIIAMTALQSSEIKEKMMNSGANDFIIKPFDVDTIQGKIAPYAGGKSKDSNAA